MAERASQAYVARVDFLKRINGGSPTGAEPANRKF